MRESKFLVKCKLVQLNNTTSSKVIVNNTVLPDDTSNSLNTIKVRNKRFDYKFKLNIHLYDDNVETVEQTFLSSWNVQAKPKRQGYKFLGWYVDSKFQTEFNVNSQCESIITDIYAKWEVNNDPFEVDLNNGSWQELQSGSYPGDDFEIYESCYGHENYDYNPCVMYINVSGVRRFTIWINSNDDSYYYDYTAASEADQTYLDSVAYEYAKGHTKNKQVNPSYYGSIDSNAWVKVTYDLDGGDHVIAVGFIDNGGDTSNYNFKRGFVAIPHEDYNDASTFIVSSIDKKYPMTGSQIIPNATVTDAFGKELTKGIDYNMTISNNVNVGNATVLITGIGKYHGSTQIYFRIYDPSSPSLDVSWNNNDWMVADKISYDGYDIYQSNTVGQDNTQAKLYIDVTGMNSLEIYINSYAESSYDYTVAMIPDCDEYNPDSGSGSGVVMETTQGFQYDPSYGIDENSWKRVYYDLNGNYSYVCIIFRKDGSASSDWDCGFVAIPTNQ